ncbi:MAG: 5-bromo-4-chloroindolyl phosphate hydrolysis family protein [Treponema sp.]|jgi:5-bromo-4-chloroindolyl phosphate hydrolysis protein|nr:5-bromo-4-chloroindolyl phosphate hydrolysis family protein [Treponema sp.]
MKKDDLVYVAVPLLIALAVFCAAVLILQWTIGVAAMLALGSYVGLSFLLTPVLRLAGVNIEHIKNGEEIMTLLEEGEKDLASIKAMIDRSNDPQITAGARHVYREGGKIIAYIRRNPAKAVMARRFFNYYLDKADELLKKYDNLVSVEIETERLRSLKTKTISALESIAKGMVLQFSRLIASDVIDIEADIKLLESTIRMEDS